RPTSVCALAQRVDLDCRFSGCKILVPLRQRPSRLPAFHFQHLVWSVGHTVSRGARPSPLLRRRHHTRTHWIQLLHNARPSTNANHPADTNKIVPATRARSTTPGRSSTMRTVHESV